MNASVHICALESPVKTTVTCDALAPKVHAATLTLATFVPGGVHFPALAYPKSPKAARVLSDGWTIDGGLLFTSAAEIWAAI